MSKSAKVWKTETDETQREKGERITGRAWPGYRRERKAGGVELVDAGEDKYTDINEGDRIQGPQ